MRIVTEESTGLSTQHALELLVDLVKRLFGRNIPAMKETPVMRRFEKDMLAALKRLEMDPGSGVDHLPLGVQRLVYEMLTQYITLYAQSPDISLSVVASPRQSDEERLSALIRQEIMHHSWPYPQSVPL